MSGSFLLSTTLPRRDWPKTADTIRRKTKVRPVLRKLDREEMGIVLGVKKRIYRRPRVVGIFSEPV